MRDRRARPRPRQPDRRAHRLQRRPRAAVRDRPRRDGHRRAARRRPRSRRAPPTSARRTRSRSPTPGRADGWRAFVRGIVAELQRRRASTLAPRAADDRRRPPARLRPVLLRRARGRAVPRAARRRRRREPDRVELAKLCSRVENDWVGARDRPARPARRRCCGERGPRAADRLRARSTLEPVPLELGDWRLVTLDSGADARARRLGGYNERRAECRAACEALGIEHLRDADPEAAERLPDAARPPRPPRADRERARRRDGRGARAPATSRRSAALLDASHASLRDDYEASRARGRGDRRARSRRAGAAGARMVGGGFGGSVLALLPAGGAVPGPRGHPGAPARLLPPARRRAAVACSSVLGLVELARPAGA